MIRSLTKSLMLVMLFTATSRLKNRMKQPHTLRLKLTASMAQSSRNSLIRH